MKSNVRRVVLFGDSVVLTSVQASLRAATDLEVATFDHLSINLEKDIRDLCPAVVIFELGSAANLPQALLHKPGLLLIGIDSETHNAMVWSGQQTVELSSRDLVEMIHKANSNAGEEQLPKTFNRTCSKGD